MNLPVWEKLFHARSLTDFAGKAILTGYFVLELLLGIFQELLQNNFPQTAQQLKIYSCILTVSVCCQHMVLLPPVP